MAVVKPDFKQIFEHPEGAVSIPPKAGTAVRRVWSDEELNNICSTLVFPVSLLQRDVQKICLTRFFRFYFDGIIPPGASPVQVVFPILAMIKISDDVGGETSLFRHNKFGQDSFFKIPPAPDTPEVLSIKQTQGPVRYKIQTGLTSDQIKKIRNLYIAFDSKQSSIFRKSVKESLESLSLTEWTKKEEQLYALSGFLALLLMRAILKDSVQMARAVNKNLIKNHVHHLTNWPIANYYSPPCRSCIRDCVIHLNKGKALPSQMFALILQAWRDLDAVTSQNKGLGARIQAGLLTHTAWNGLGLVQLMFRAVDLLGITVGNLYNHTLTEMSVPSWTLLAEFAARYMKANESQRTYVWARIISDGYFPEYASRLHPYLSGIFAGIIDYSQATGSVKDSAWFKNRRVQAEQGYEFGQKVILSIQTTPDIGFTPEARAIAASLKRTNAMVKTP